jgi:hypothetical protein
MGTSISALTAGNTQSVAAFLIAIIITAGILVRFKAAGYERSGRAYPILLATFPLYYWVFALYAADYQALMNEIIVGVVFIGLAWLAYRLHDLRALLILAIGFISHGVYDIVHSRLFASSVAPTWWPEFCGSIDLLLGMYMLWLAKLHGRSKQPAQ